MPFSSSRSSAKTLFDDGGWKGNWSLACGVQTMRGDAFAGRFAGHDEGGFEVRRSVVYAVNQVVMNVDQYVPCYPRLIAPPERSSWRKKSSSRRPSPAAIRWSGRDAASCPAHFDFRSGCLQCCSSDPLGLASGVISPCGRRVAKRDAILGFKPRQFLRRAEVVPFHVADGNLQHFSAC